MTYAEEHAGALEAVAETGSAWTFTLASPGVSLPGGGFSGASTQTVSGYAIQVKGEGQDLYAGYEGGETNERYPLTLLFVPSTLGEVPPLLSVGRSGSISRRVKKRRSVAPDGVAIATYVVLE